MSDLPVSCHPWLRWVTVWFEACFTGLKSSALTHWTMAVPGTAAVARIVVFSSWLCCQCLRCTFVSVWSVLESCMGENASLPPVEQKKFFTLLLNPRVTHNSWILKSVYYFTLSWEWDSKKLFLCHWTHSSSSIRVKFIHLLIFLNLLIIKSYTEYNKHIKEKSIKKRTQRKILSYHLPFSVDFWLVSSGTSDVPCTSSWYIQQWTHAYFGVRSCLLSLPHLHL